MTFLTALIPSLVLVALTAGFMLHRFGREIRSITERYEHRAYVCEHRLVGFAEVSYHLAAHAAATNSCEVCGRPFAEGPVLMRIEHPRIDLAHPFCLAPPSPEARDVLVWGMP